MDRLPKALLGQKTGPRGQLSNLYLMVNIFFAVIRLLLCFPSRFMTTRHELTVTGCCVRFRKFLSLVQKELSKPLWDIFPGKTEFRWLMDCDYSGWIPAGILNMAMPIAQMDFAGSVRKLALAL